MVDLLPQNDEHCIELDEFFKRLKCSNEGLSSEEALNRQREYGLNVLEEKEKRSLIVWFGKHLVNFFALLLWTGAALAFISEYLVPGEGNLYIGIALAGVVILNAIFTFIQEYQSEQIMDSFRKMMPSKINVVRDGKRREVLAGEIVPGDLVYLEEGNKIPADGRLIEENSLKVDHSALTGESEPQLRKIVCTHENILESRNMVFSGTLVQSGNGTALVFGTGMNTQLGKIASLTKETKDVDSPLKKELNRFIRIISIIAITLGITFFAVSFMTGNRLMASLILRSA
jgi:sodium/potassium-transporting ATPase subunit alpha